MDTDVTLSAEGDQLLTIEQVCQRVQLSPCAVRRAITRGELQAYKLASRIRIPESAVAAWLDRSEVGVTIEDGPVPLLAVAGRASSSFRDRAKIS